MKKHGAKVEYSKISPQIYLGTNACCQLHFKRELLAKGIKADISMEEERIDAAWGVDYFLWLPTRDHTAPKFHQLMSGAKQLDYLVENKIKTYIHCKNGHGRGPSLVAAYFIYKGMSFDEAHAFVKKKRKEIHLEKAQIAALKRFERKVRSGKYLV